MADNGSLSEGFRNKDIIESAAHFSEIDVAHFSLHVEIGTDGDVIFPEPKIPGDRTQGLAGGVAKGGTPDQVGAVHVQELGARWNGRRSSNGIGSNL